jgi:hypothetical protein
MVSGLIGSVSREVNNLCLGIVDGWVASCDSDFVWRQIEEFGEKFAAAINPTCTVASETSQGCTVSKIFCGDWTSADWYCPDNRFYKANTYQFKEAGEEYSVMGLIGNSIVLFHDGEYATEVGVKCGGFYGKKEDADLLKILKNGVKAVTGEDIKIHLQGDCGIWGCDDL